MDKEIQLAVASLFLLLTGLRTREAINLKLCDFGSDLVIRNFHQEKPQRFVFLTKQFREIANSNNWSSIPWNHSWLSQKLRHYHLCCHAFRHIFLTRRTQFIGNAIKSTRQALQ